MGTLAVARSLLRGLAWLVIAVLVALGGAGIVAAMDHVPGTPARPELTWAADQRVRPALDAATARLEALSADVDAFAADAREALTQVIARDLDALEAAVEQGSTDLERVEAEAAAFREEVDGVPGMGPGAELRVSAALRERHASLVDATVITADLGTAWRMLDDRALTSARVASLLNRHDEQAGAAVRAGSEGRYAEALTQLDAATATVGELRSAIEGVKDSADVATLTDWVDRNAAYDAALRALYDAVLAAEGRSTPAVRAALAGEREARAKLPKDNRALIVIMSDLAQGGINQAVVRIEEARGRLEGAIRRQHELASGVELPG